MITSLEIDISSPPSGSAINVEALQKALTHGLMVEGVEQAVLSVTLVDNTTIHALNRKHLQHDYPTDVISFPLEWNCPGETQESRLALTFGRSEGASLEGEIVVSVEYAADMALRCGWSTQEEVTLYTIHGLLHICGYDDLTADEKDVMRSREHAILNGLGIYPVYPDDDVPHTEDHK